MSFFHPALLGAGLACVAIPILIHLLMRRRRRPVPWAAMRFLLEAYKQHRRRLTLEQLLLLLTRCALVALLALGLGRPALEAAGLIGSGRPVNLYLLVDNSLASAHMDTDGTSALERHVERAGELVDALDTSRGDRAGLVLMGGPAEAIVVPASSDLAGVRDRLASLAPTDSRADLHGALTALIDGAQETGPGEQTVVVALCDWMQGSVTLDTELPILPEGWTLAADAPRPAELGTAGLVGLEPTQSLVVGDAMNAVPVRVRAERSGPGTDTQATVGVSLAWAGHAGTPVATAPLRFEPGAERAETVVQIMLDPAQGAGDRVLAATLDDDANPRDNTLARPLGVRARLNVGIVSSHDPGAPTGVEGFMPARWVRLALAPGAGSEGVSASWLAPTAIDQSRLAPLDAVVVVSPASVPESGWRRLGELARHGGVVVVFADADTQAQPWGPALTQATGLDWTISPEPVEPASPEELDAAVETDPATGLFASIAPELGDLVKPVRLLRRLAVGGPRGDVQLRTRAGEAIVLASPPAGGSGLVVVCAFAASPTWTDLPAKPMMVPFMQELVRRGVGRALSGRMGIAGAPPPAPPSAARLSGIGADDAQPDTPARHAGAWTALDADGRSLGLVVVNPDAGGASADDVDPQTLEAWLAGAGTPTAVDALLGAGDAAERTRRSDAGWSLWLLMGALACAVIESPLARWASHAEIAPARAGGGRA